MIRILQIIGSLERAGAETFLMNLYRNIDRTKIQFDFAIYDKPSANCYYDEVIEMGARVYTIPPKTQGLWKNFRRIKRIVRDNQYAIVWRQASSCWGGLDVIAAKAGGAKTCILHSHSSNSFGIEKYLHYLCRPVVNHFVDHRFACGMKAGIWMYGRREFQIINNGIDMGKFSRNEQVRRQYRQYFHLDNRTVLGHVGRFQRVKNHRFLIEVFEKYMTEDPSAVLVLVGDGSLMMSIRQIVEEKELQDQVLFLGNRSDVAELMQMMDVFIMPSIYEGFPVTLVEAQATGLPCLVSDSITNEVKIHSNVIFESLSAPTELWAKDIAQLSNMNNILGNSKRDEFDIQIIAKQVEDKVCAWDKENEKIHYHN